MWSEQNGNKERNEKWQNMKIWEKKSERPQIQKPFPVFCFVFRSRSGPDLHRNFGFEFFFLEEEDSRRPQ